MSGLLVFAFVAGTVATANPCGFALLPAYLARQIGADRPEMSIQAAVIRALLVGAVTTAGFLVVFGSIGSVISLGARSVTQAMPWVALAIGVVLFAAGVAVLAGKHIAIRLPAIFQDDRGSGTASVFLFGLGYGVASLSCTLPIFLAVLGTAVTSDPLTSVLSFAAYGTGMGTVLTALAVAAALSRTGLAGATRRILPHVSRISGVLLAAAGAYVVNYWSFTLGLLGAEVPAPIQAVEQLSSQAQGWLQGTAGRATSVILLAGLAVLIIWAAWRVFRRRGASLHPAPTERASAPAGADGYPDVNVPAELAERLRDVLGLERTPATLGDVTGTSPSGPPLRPEELYTDGPTRHEVRVNGHTGYTHCVLDALLAASLTAETAEVRSTSPLGDLVTAQVGPSGAQAVPASTVVSYGVARAGHGREQPACPYINAFPSREAYQRWAAATPHALTISLALHDAVTFTRAMARRNPACTPADSCC